MGEVPATELAKISYLDTQAMDGRSLLIMPFWDGSTWHLWAEAPPGSIIKINIIDAVHSNYVAKAPARTSDIWIRVIEYMWQRLSWPNISKKILSIQDDIHLLTVSFAKLSHFYAHSDQIGDDIVRSFVKSELEYIITVSRSIFDLLQEIIAELWNNQTKLQDPIKEATRKRHKLPSTFTKCAIEDRKRARSIDELVEKYAISPPLAESYNYFAPFYVSLLNARDGIIHFGSSVETIFSTNKGFCVSKHAKPFSNFDWKPEHAFNENIVSLLPWIADVVFGTINACDHIMDAFASSIVMPPEMAPGYHIFIRDPTDSAFSQLARVNDGSVVWWSELIPEY